MWANVIATEWMGNVLMQSGATNWNRFRCSANHGHAEQCERFLKLNHWIVVIICNFSWKCIFSKTKNNKLANKLFLWYQKSMLCSCVKESNDEQLNQIHHSISHEKCSAQIPFKKNSTTHTHMRLHIVRIMKSRLNMCGEGRCLTMFFSRRRVLCMQSTS